MPKQSRDPCTQVWDCFGLRLGKREANFLVFGLIERLICLAMTGYSDIPTLPMTFLFFANCQLTSDLP
jgi:hypothetical protein